MTNLTRKQYSHDALIRYAKYLGTAQIHTIIDHETDLHAIVAVHSTKRGPAIGGCRLFPYMSPSFALKDVLRLSYQMTLKAAVSELNHGGAKAVIIKKPHIKCREAMFHKFGEFVHQLNGSYITAMDMGTSTQDMNTIAHKTPHVIGSKEKDIHQSDPSPFTADGVFHGIRAAVEFKMKRQNLEGIRVSVQGAGKVAYYLCKHLHKAGAILTVCDTNHENAQRVKDEMNATIVAPEAIYDVPADLFAPCAIGGTLNANTIQRLDAEIIAGAANNQFSHRKFSKVLHEKGVLYAPDFMLNAGGLIQAASLHDFSDISYANQLIDRLYERMHMVFERSACNNQTPTDVAEKIAFENIENYQPEALEETV